MSRSSVFSVMSLDFGVEVSVPVEGVSVAGGLSEAIAVGGNRIGGAVSVFGVSIRGGIGLPIPNVVLGIVRMGFAVIFSDIEGIVLFGVGVVTGPAIMLGGVGFGAGAGM